MGFDDPKVDLGGQGHRSKFKVNRSKNVILLVILQLSWNYTLYPSNNPLQGFEIEMWLIFSRQRAHCQCQVAFFLINIDFFLILREVNRHSSLKRHGEHMLLKGYATTVLKKQ